jgi:hypothetical protein
MDAAPAPDDPAQKSALNRLKELLARQVTSYETRSEIEEIRDRLNQVRAKRSLYGTLGRWIPAAGIVLSATTIWSSIEWFDNNRALEFIGIVYLLMGLLFPLFNYAGALDTEIEALESEIALRMTDADASEQRAERLFKSHGIDLRRYYQQTLRQSSCIFVAGIGCIAAGFVSNCSSRCRLAVAA